MPWKHPQPIKKHHSPPTTTQLASPVFWMTLKSMKYCSLSAATTWSMLPDPSATEENKSASMSNIYGFLYSLILYTTTSSTTHFLSLSTRQNENHKLSETKTKKQKPPWGSPLKSSRSQNQILSSRPEPKETYMDRKLRPRSMLNLTNLVSTGRDYVTAMCKDSGKQRR